MVQQHLMDLLTDLSCHKRNKHSSNTSNAEILRVSINGVMQQPNDGTGQGDMTDGYVVSGTDIIFDSAPPSGSTYFIINMGTQIAIGNATTSTIADESSDTTCFPLFATAATGDLGLKSQDLILHLTLQMEF